MVTVAQATPETAQRLFRAFYAEFPQALVSWHPSHLMFVDEGTPAPAVAELRAFAKGFLAALQGA